MTALVIIISDYAFEQSEVLARPKPETYRQSI